MANDFRPYHYTPRSFAQVALDRSKENALDAELRDVRRVVRALAPMANKYRLGVDLSVAGNIRVRDGKIIIFVKNAPQAGKVKQLIPRLEEAVYKSGITYPMECQIRPAVEPMKLRQNDAMGAPREAGESTTETLRKKAEGMEPSALRTALMKLADSIEQA